MDTKQEPASCTLNQISPLTLKSVFTRGLPRIKGHTEATNQPGAVLAANHESVSKQDTKFIPFPMFIVDGFDESSDSFSRALNKAITSCCESLPLIESASGFDMYPAEQHLTDKMNGYLNPHPIPVQEITDNMSQMTLSQASLFFANASESNHKVSSPEKHVSFSNGGSVDIRDSVGHSNERSSVPFKKRPLQPDSDSQGSSKKMIGRSLNEMLDYHISCNMKKVRTKTSGIKQQYVPEQLHTGNINMKSLSCQNNIDQSTSNDTLAISVKSHNEKVAHQPPSTGLNDLEWDAATLFQLDESLNLINEMFINGSQNQKHSEMCNNEGIAGQGSCSSISVPLRPKIFYHVFSSTPEKANLSAAAKKTGNEQWGRNLDCSSYGGLLGL